MDNTDINEIFDNALKDPSLLSKLDIDKLLDSLENPSNDYLENKTLSDVTNTVYDKLKEIGIENENIEILCNKLIGYRYVDEIFELHKGKMVRWLNLDNNKLTNGGIVVDIKFLKDGTQILCMNTQKRFIQYKFDNCYTFQKMTPEEQLILMAYENINS
tara:strand:- start:11279 stop:11755 length:477 start_codon:yes stop_codon:yes gene_type:complete